MHINGLLLSIIMESVVMLGFLISITYHIIKKKELFPTIFQGKEDIVAKIFALAAVAIIVVYEIVPQCMDLPYSYNNELCYMEGEAVTHSDRSAARGGHSVDIKDKDSGEIIHVRFSYKGTIERGDQLKVKYLPNSKRAILLEVNGRKQTLE